MNKVSKDSGGPVSIVTGKVEDIQDIGVGQARRAPMGRTRAQRRMCTCIVHHARIFICPPAIAT